MFWICTLKDNCYQSMLLTGCISSPENQKVLMYFTCEPTVISSCDETMCYNWGRVVDGTDSSVWTADGCFILVGFRGHRQNVVLQKQPTGFWVGWGVGVVIELSLCLSRHASQPTKLLSINSINQHGVKKKKPQFQWKLSRKDSAAKHTHTVHGSTSSDKIHTRQHTPWQ